MRINYPKLGAGVFALFVCLAGQSQTNIKDFVLYGGSTTCPSSLQTNPQAPGCALVIGNSTTIVNGKLGSGQLVTTSSSVTIGGDILSGGRTILGGSNIINGNVTSRNGAGISTNVFEIGSGGSISGNVKSAGKAVNSGSVISGSVTVTPGFLYTGPAPAGGVNYSVPQMDELPTLPGITNFPAAGSTSITTTGTITPGQYDKILLTGNKTLTFSGPGTYVFNSIKNAGAVNTLVFDFQNNATAGFKIYVHGDVDLNRSNVMIINGGSPSRIYAETHGNGSTSVTGTSAWHIANGSGSSNVQISAWAGTIWAPYAGIHVGNQTSTSRIRGALWSGTQVRLVGGVTIEHYPSTIINTGDIFPYYPPPNNFKVNDLIGSELNSLFFNSGTGQTHPDIFLLASDSVWIEVIAIQGQRAALAGLLTSAAYGMTDTISNGLNSLIITGKYPISKLLLLNALPSMISFARPAFPPVTSSGIVQTMGDSSMRTNYVRNGFGLDGAGVRIGVLSDSYNTLPNDPASQDVANDDLPGRVGNPVNETQVTVLKDFPFGRRSDEGRAMLQIVHDVAPKASLAFRTGFLTAGDFALGIRELAADNCDVIVDDITYITEPFFDRGVVERAISDVTASGVHYVTAAGNFGQKSYTGIFNPLPAPAGLAGVVHDFGGGDFLQNDSIKGSSLVPGNYTLVLQWEDDIYSLGSSPTGTLHDLDIYLANEAGIPLFGFNRNNIGGDPIEVLPFTVTANTTCNIMIIKAASAPGGSGSIRFKYVVFRGDLKINEFSQGNSTIVGHANAPDAITVGAALYTNTPAFGVSAPTEASFSSLGGTPVDNVTPAKPDLVGPNGINTTVNFSSLDLEGDGFPNFYGTSAAAPHVAAASSLIVQAYRRYFNTDISAADLKQLLNSSAIDMRTPGFDFQSGWGFVQVDAAMRTFANPRPQINKLELVDSSLTPGLQPMDLRVLGDYLNPNTRIIFGTDTLATTVISNNEAIATIPSFTSEKYVYMYSTPRTVSGLDGGLSNGMLINGIPKKNVTIIADNKQKKFGEELPVFTATILVDGDSLHLTSLTAADLGLENIQFQTQATPLSNTGIYFIRPGRIFDPSDPADSTLLEYYNYGFSDGALTISKLPVTITARDTTLLYGERIAGFNFDYSIDPGANISDPAGLLNSISIEHESQVESDIIGLVNGQAVTIVNGQAIPIVNGQAVTIVNGQAVTIVNGQEYPIINAQAITIVNGQAVTIVNSLTEEQTESLSFLATQNSLDNTRDIQSYLMVNGTAIPQTTTVIDITQESIIKFNTNTAQTSLTSSVSLVNARGLVDQPSYSDGQAVTIVNGQAITIVNGQAITIVNGQAVTIVNGQAVTIVNGQAIPIVNGTSRTAVIVDETDLGDGINPVKPVSVITGNTPGVHTILPASLVNNNLQITYEPGLLTIEKLNASVTAQDKVIFKGDALPAFTSTVTGFMPGQIPQIAYSLSPAYTGNAGVYDIIPALVSYAFAENYNVAISNGKLYVNPKGAGAKKLRPYLDCVEVLPVPVNGKGFIAHFYCINDNSTPVYVPIGNDNKVSSSGNYDASQQPFLFNPGITNFSVPFDGVTLKWELRTYETNRKTSTASTASSTSNKCNNRYTRGTSPEVQAENHINKIVYPNPAKETITITGSDFRPLSVIDSYGRSYGSNSFRKIPGGKWQMNVSLLPPGIYTVRFEDGSSTRFIKE